MVTRSFCIMYHGFKGFPTCTTVRPLPRLVTIHPYSRSSALTRFFYGSIHFHISPHITTCSAATSPLGAKGLLGLFTDMDTRVSSVCWCLPHPFTSYDGLHIPENTIHTTRRYTHPYPSHSNLHGTCRWLVHNTTIASARLRSFNLLTVWWGIVMVVSAPYLILTPVWFVLPLHPPPNKPS